MNASLSSIVKGSEVSSSSTSQHFISYGDGILDDGFFMGSLVTEHLNSIVINNLTSYIFSIPKNGAYSVKDSKNQEKSAIGKLGVLALATDTITYDSATQFVDDYAIIVDKKALNSGIEKKYKLPYQQKNMLTLNLRDEQVQSCFQFVESTLNMVRSFPASRHSVLVKQNVKEIASFMLVDIIAESLQAKPLLNQNPERILVSTAEEIMSAECRNLFTIQEIADRLFTSPRNLQRAFKKHRDHTPLQFLLKSKLVEANKILLDNQNPFLTIKEVALHVGIVDLNRFGKYYFKHFGEYPKDTLKK